MLIKKYNRINLSLCRSKAIILFFCSILLAGCGSTPKYFTDYDRNHKFENYQRFTWLGEDPGIVIGETLLPNKISSLVTKSIREQLEAKDYVFTPNVDEADFMVSFTIGVRQNFQLLQKFSKIYDNNENWLWGKEYHGYLSPEWGDGEPITYTRGVLAIDVFDVIIKAPVWHAKATGIIHDDDLRSPGADIELVVSKILESFPPSE